GPTLDDVARSLCRSMPVGGVCVTAERDRLAILRTEAAKRDCELVVVDPESVTDAEMSGFDWITFKENVAVALAVGGRPAAPGRGRGHVGGPTRPGRAARDPLPRRTGPGAVRERLRRQRPGVDADEHRAAARPGRHRRPAARGDQLPAGPGGAQRADGRVGA